MENSSKRKNFISRLSIFSNKNKNWKEPTAVSSRVLYKNIKLPNAYFTDLITEDLTEFLGDNSYRFKTENLNLDAKYNLIENLLSRTIDSLGFIVQGTENQKPYERFCQIYNARHHHAISLAHLSNKQDAIKVLEDLLKDTTNFYKETIKTDNKEIEER